MDWLTIGNSDLPCHPISWTKAVWSCIWYPQIWVIFAQVFSNGSVISSSSSKMWQHDSWISSLLSSKRLSLFHNCQTWCSVFFAYTLNSDWQSWSILYMIIPLFQLSSFFAGMSTVLELWNHWQTSSPCQTPLGWWTTHSLQLSALVGTMVCHPLLSSFGQPFSWQRLATYLMILFSDCFLGQ